MLWDDNYLYVAAEIRSNAELPVVARYKSRNSPIFHTDSDFEVFVDPAGCCHGYKELEMNAINTVWNLMLDRPYMDGGCEYSGRVASSGEEHYYEVHKQHTATRMVQGELESAADALWTCEIALAHSDSLAGLDHEIGWPKPGMHWRINFSRVERQGAVNWVWSPQRAWSPQDGRLTGQVNMHIPESWGYLHFVGAESKLDACMPEDPAWPARLLASCVYFAQHAYRKEHSKFAASIEALEELLPSEMLDGAVVDIVLSSNGEFVATICKDAVSVTMKHDHLMSQSC